MTALCMKKIEQILIECKTNMLIYLFFLEFTVFKLELSITAMLKTVYAISVSNYNSTFAAAKIVSKCYLGRRTCSSGERE